MSKMAAFNWLPGIKDVLSASNDVSRVYGRREIHPGMEEM